MAAVKVLDSKITKQELINNHLQCFKTMAKAVVDIDRRVMAVDGELHADLEALLIESGSAQENLWGINLYPHKPRSEFIEYTALINIRPHQNNSSMEIADQDLRDRIRSIVDGLIDHGA